MIATIFYFAAEENSVCKRKKLTSVSSTGHDLDVSFFVTLAVIFRWKRLRKSVLLQNIL